MVSIVMRPALPCPFCGGAGAQCHAEEVGDNVWTVICEACGANGPLDTGRANSASRAVGEWDTRRDPNCTTLERKRDE